ncbi:MAG: MFS transporter [Bacteroidetes bacterium]|nr:MAG: MFS transporter [Bacteroidota bacterium]
MTTTSTRLSVREKIGYSLGDLSANLVFQTLMTFLAFFYTDVFKIPPASAAAVMLIGGILGATFNLVMGAIADRTVTRWGKFRPWVLWTAVPFGISAFLAFSTPDLGESGKIAYAFFTYLLLVIMYSANNLPYSALSGVMTGDMNERNSLSSYRFVAVMVAQFVTQVLLLPMVLYLGGGDQPAGFKMAVGIFAIVSVICFIITFLTTRERIVPTPEQKSSVAQDLDDLSRNRPWIVMLALTIMVFITLALKGGSYIYFFRNYLDQESLRQFLSGWGMAGDPGSDYASTAFSIFNAGGIIFMIVGILFSKPLAGRFGKRDVFGWGLFASALFVLALYFMPPQAVGLVILAQILHGFFYGITIPLLWAMIADVADYSEWKNNRRATAIIFSAMIFGLKVGLSIGGALLGTLLAMSGYDSNLTTQTPEAVEGIRRLVSIYPTLFFVAACGLLFFYEINKSKETQIEQELSQRRA